MKYLAPVFLLMLFFGSDLFAQTDEIQKKVYQFQEKRVSDLEREIASLRKELSTLKMAPVPDHLFLCDKPLPLSDDDVREDFEREFFQFLENKGLLTILVKRHGKYFTLVSNEISRMNLPPDLIYLAMVESYMNPRAKSSANAGGMWQFIKETGKREGLFVSDHVDERFTVTKSTRSALGYLSKLYAEFGDWFLAMAAYNAGEARVREAIANQNSRDFFQLFLPEETDRYVFRIAAMREILGNPKLYGLPIEKKDYYRPFAVAEVTIEVERETHTSLLAQAMDLPYKVFREHNLHIRKYVLPRGIYHLYVPVEKKEAFLKGIRICPNVVLQKEG